MATINIGPTVSDRGSNFTFGRTNIDLAGTADGTGTITSIHIWVLNAMTGFRVGTFYYNKGDGKYYCRDSAVIGNVVAGESTITQDSIGNPLAIEVAVGDFIGGYWASGNIERDGDGGSGIMTVVGEYIDPGDSATYSLSANDVMSLHGTGVTGVSENVFDGSGTISTWINPRSDGGGDSGRIVTKTDKWTLWVTSEASGKVKLNFFLAFSTTGGNWATTNAEVALNAWSHVAVVYDSSNVANDPIIYVNGVSVALTEMSTPVGTRVSDVGFNLLLANRAAQDRGFDGVIGDFCLCNRLLTPQEIQSIYFSSKGSYR